MTLQQAQAIKAATTVIRHPVLQYREGVGYIQARADGTWSAHSFMAGGGLGTYGLTKQAAREAVLVAADRHLLTLQNMGR